MGRHLGLHSQADSIDGAVLRVMAEGRVRTREMGGTSSTTDFTLATIAELN